jgi:dTDP-4-amino-4,6-dideoxygalactose transaminase
VIFSEKYIMKTIKFNEPYITGRELEYIQDVFFQKKFYGTGKYTTLCEEKIKSITGAKHALLTDSCTAALEITALLLRDFDKQQEVIVPSYTFSSTASAFARAGFKIVFCECDDKNMMMDINDVQKKITKNTVAIIPVHYGGLAANIRPICELAKKLDLVVVEDAAQGFNSSLDNQQIGTFGNFGCFSFHETKNIHCGLGGALLVNDEKYLNRARHIWERGTNRQEVLKGLVDKYSWVEIGGSFYPSELQSAFLFAQLEGLDDNLKKRKVIYEIYSNKLKELKEKDKFHFPCIDSNLKSNYHAFFIIFNSESDADGVRQFLVANDVHAYIGYVALHSSPVGIKMGYKPESLSKTELLAKRVLRLPFHNNMSEKDTDRVANLINEYFNAN